MSRKGRRRFDALRAEQLGPRRCATHFAAGHARRRSRSAAGALPWQVVGMVERATSPPTATTRPTYWREYLLYHHNAGFAFVVDAEDGWSWAGRSPARCGARRAGAMARRDATGGATLHRQGDLGPRRVLLARAARRARAGHRLRRHRPAQEPRPRADAATSRRGPRAKRSTPTMLAKAFGVPIAASAGGSAATARPCWTGCALDLQGACSRGV